MADTSLLPVVIGGLVTLSGVVITQLWVQRREEVKESNERDDRYVNWMRALQAECGHLQVCIEEIKPSYGELTKGNYGRCPTKRLNSDVLAAARTEILAHPRSAVVFPHLTAAYRDVQHANEMMDRCEAQYLEYKRTGLDEIRLKLIVAPTSTCLKSLGDSLATLNSLLREQENLVTQNRDRFFQFLEGAF